MLFPNARNVGCVDDKHFFNRSRSSSSKLEKVFNIVSNMFLSVHLGTK